MFFFVLFSIIIEVYYGAVAKKGHEVLDVINVCCYC